MDHAAIINRWPSLSEFAADIGVSYVAAKAMRRRNSIPGAYWLLVVESAARRTIPISLEDLARAVVARPTSEEAAA